MSEQGHTPGPWRVEYGVNIMCADGKQWDDREIGQAALNARLIAAAPDMLDALKHCVIERSEWLAEARAAIAKATEHTSGKSNAG